MAIIVKVTVQAVARGKTWKAVSCEHCACDYAYEMFRSSEVSETGTLGARDKLLARAEEKAAANVARALSKEVDAIWCPACGHYQANMLPQLRHAAVAKLYVWPLLVVGAAVVGAAVVGHRPGWVDFPEAAVDNLFKHDTWLLAALAVAVAIAAAIRISSRRMDPNATAADRLQHERSRAMPRAAFIAWRAANPVPANEPQPVWFTPSPDPAAEAAAFAPPPPRIPPAAVGTFRW